MESQPKKVKAIIHVHPDPLDPLHPQVIVVFNDDDEVDQTPLQILKQERKRMKKNWKGHK